MTSKRKAMVIRSVKKIQQDSRLENGEGAELGSRARQSSILSLWEGDRPFCKPLICSLDGQGGRSNGVVAEGVSPGDPQMGAA